MINVAVCIFGILGILACRTIENAMWEYDYEKALGCEFEYYDGAKINGGK